MTSTKWTQDNRLFKLEATSVGEDTLLIEEFAGTEAVSQPFSFDLSLISEDAGLELKDLMGELFKMEVQTAKDEPRYFSGYVTQFAHTGSDGGVATYQAILGPWTEFLRHRINSRIFQNMNVIDILRMVFNEYGELARFEIGVKSSYNPLTLCAQYQESDLNFIMRLMEEHGLYFYFQFEEDGHILKIEDDSTNAPDMPIESTIEYNLTPSSAEKDTIGVWEAHRELVSNKYAAKTFDFKNPRDPMKASVETNYKMGDLPKMEWYEHKGAFTYKDDRAGDQWVKLRIEEQELKSKVFLGGGNVRHLTCGHVFELAMHYGADLSLHDRNFFVMSVTHRGNNNYRNEGAEPVYGNHFTCVRKKIPFRPSRVTEKPVMRGPQTAIVVGPSGEEIFCDKYGRVRVQFHWDREGSFDDKSSCWLRVATQWAGQRFGFVSLPRVGTEVMVDFLEGDPDRPIITGAVYNELNMPPWELPTNKTQSGVLTQSSKGGSLDNANALRFEDLKGQEEIWLHAEKDQRIEVEHDESHWVGHDRKKNVDHDETTTIGNNRTEKVGVNEDITIGANRTEKVGANEDITIGANRTEKVGANEDITIGGSQAIIIMQAKSETVLLASTEQVGLARNLTVGAAYTIEVGAAMNTAVGLSQTEQVGIDQSITVGKNHSLSAGKKIHLTAGDELTITVGNASLVMKKDGTIKLNGKTINLSSTSDTTIKAKGNLVQKGQKITEN